MANSTPRQPRFLRRLWAPDTLFWELSGISWLLFLPYLMTAHGHLDWSRHALGRDFVNVWTAGHLVFTPHRLDIFDPSRFLSWERRLFDPRLRFHFWSYPPPALFLAAPLSIFSYIPGLAAWSLAGLAALVPAYKSFFGRSWDRWMCLAAPAAAVNIALGQNGAFTGALTLAGLALWSTRPRLAGALLGLLIFKPQLAIMIPVAIIADRRWDGMIAGASVAVGVLLLSALAFGVEAWRGFFGPTLAMQGLMLSHGRGPFQWMMPSVFMAARVSGLPSPVAMLVQIPFFVLGVWMTWKTYKGPGDVTIKGAVLILATLIASPQAFNYDLIPAAAAALVLLRRDRSLLGMMLALVLWALPVLLLATEVIHFAIGPVVLLAAGLRLYAIGRRPALRNQAESLEGPSLGSGLQRHSADG